jgi:hypothetical protein
MAFGETQRSLLAYRSTGTGGLHLLIFIGKRQPKKVTSWVKWLAGPVRK